MIKSRWRSSTWLYYAILGMVCLHFALAYTRLLPTDPPYHDYAAGIAADPYQTRILMSLVFKMALDWKFLAALSHHLAGPYGDPLILLMLPIVAASMFAATEAVRYATRNLGVPEVVSRWGAFCVLLMAYFNYLVNPEVSFQTPYDVPQVAVFAICLAAILKRNRFVFYVLFMIGTLNRETTCFLVPIFGLLEWHRATDSTVQRHGRLFAELGLLSALWLALRYFSSHFYEQHPLYAGILLRRNLGFLINPFHWPVLTSVFAFLWILYLLQFRRIGHRGLQFCAILLPLWLAVMLVAGDPLEIRIHSEWIGYLAVCLILIVADLLKSTAKFEPPDLSQREARSFQWE
jgi:hypothetical protein